MTDYPILVEKFEGRQAFTLGCLGCTHRWHAREDDGAEEFIEWIEAGHCPKCGDFRVVPVYEEGSKCPGCGTLRADLDRRGALKGACSRACMLQAEYAESLKARAS